VGLRWKKANIFIASTASKNAKCAAFSDLKSFVKNEGIAGFVWYDSRAYALTSPCA
jgi:hypothetical protein